jgi:hypothetical protein
MTFSKPLGDGFELRQLMPWINRGGHFILTEGVRNNCLAKSIYGGSKKITVS